MFLFFVSVTTLSSTRPVPGTVLSLEAAAVVGQVAPDEDRGAAKASGLV